MVRINWKSNIYTRRFHAIHCLSFNDFWSTNDTRDINLRKNRDVEAVTADCDSKKITARISDIFLNKPIMTDSTNGLNKKKDTQFSVLLPAHFSLEWSRPLRGLTGRAIDHKLLATGFNCVKQQRFNNEAGIIDNYYKLLGIKDNETMTRDCRENSHQKFSPEK